MRESISASVFESTREYFANNCQRSERQGRGTADLHTSLSFLKLVLGELLQQSRRRAGFSDTVKLWGLSEGHGRRMDQEVVPEDRVEILLRSLTPLSLVCQLIQ